MTAPLIEAKRFSEITSGFKNLNPVFVLGDVGLDKYTFGEVNRISPEAPVPVLRVTKEWEKLGLAANISHNLKTLEVNSTLCGVAGEDKFADQLENLLEACDLKTWGIVRTPGRKTTYKERATTAAQQICRIDYESTEAIDKKTEEMILERIDDLLPNHSAMIIEDYSKGMLTETLTQSSIKKAKELGIFVAVDPGRKTNPLVFKGADLLKPNLAECRIMLESLGYGFNQKSIEEMGEILLDKLNLKQVVITLGPEGMGLMSTSEPKLKRIPTVAPEVFDVSGAGDTSITLLTIAIQSGASLEEAAWIGNCGAGVVVGKRGTATVDTIELSDFYNRLRLRYK
jgi:rfaE bifunctional protein kinase chain/domain